MKNYFKILKTKTFWLNIIGGALIILNDQVLGKMIPTADAAVILSVLNILNRYLTNTPVSEK